MPTGVPSSSFIDMDTLRSTIFESWEYLQVPSLEDYSHAWKDTLWFSYKAFQSIGFLLYLILRPWILGIRATLLYLWTHLVWKFTKESVQQLQYGLKRIIQFQLSLSGRQVALEIIVMGIGILLYLLRRYIQKQAYVQRFQRWYSKKQRELSKSYRSTVDRISQTSLWIAMIFPHALFAGVCLGVKLLIPSVVTFFARDTPLYFLLSVVYPWISTVQILYQYRNPHSVQKKLQQEKKKQNVAKGESSTDNDKENTMNDNSNNNNKKKNKPFFPKSTNSVKAKSRLFEPTQSSQRKQTNKNKNTMKSPQKNSKTGGRRKGNAGRSASPNPSNNNNNYNKKKSSTTTTAVDRFLATKQQNDIDTSTTTTTTPSLETQANYWLSYWMMYALVEGFTRMIFLLPIVGRIATSTGKSSLMTSITIELQLFYIVWIFGLEYALQQTSSSSSSDSNTREYKVRPLTVLKKYLLPPTRQVYETLSLQIITEETWNTQVVTKVKSLLEMARMMKLLKESTTQMLVRGMEGAHPFLIPSLTLFAPLGFVTQYGVIYVQSIVPCCSSYRYRRSQQQQKKDDDETNSSSLAQTCNLLQYWVLQGLVQACLTWWSGILWWIPFSTHMIFILWCRLQFVSNDWFAILEMELSAFGLIVGPLDTTTNNDTNGGGGGIALEDTVTVKVASQVWKRVLATLPSVHDSVKEKKNDDDDAAAVSSSKEDDSTSISPKDHHVPPANAFQHEQLNNNQGDDEDNDDDENDSNHKKMTTTNAADNDDESSSTSNTTNVEDSKKKNANEDTANNNDSSMTVIEPLCGNEEEQTTATNNDDEATTTTPKKKTTKNDIQSGVDDNNDDVTTTTTKPTSSTLREEDLMSLTVIQLKERLRESGQKVSGNKKELVERLLDSC